MSYISGIPTQRYNVISHIWGPKFTWHPDPLNTTNKGQTLVASPEKLKALYRIISDDRNKLAPFWCDIYSIDQNDAADKSAQVEVMGDIYRNAEKCCVLLTEGDAKIFRLSLQVLNHLAPLWEAGNITMPLTVDMELVLHGLYGRLRALAGVNNSPYVCRWCAASHADRQIRSQTCDDRCKRQPAVELVWTKRVWTAQEVYLSSKIDYHDHMGEFVADHLILKRGYRALLGLTEMLESTARWTDPDQSAFILATLYRRLEQAIKPLGLSGVAQDPHMLDQHFQSIIRDVSTRDCYMKADYVYGVRGLLGLDVSVDYKCEQARRVREGVFDMIRKGKLAPGERTYMLEYPLSSGMSWAIAGMSDGEERANEVWRTLPISTSSGLVEFDHVRIDGRAKLHMTAHALPMSVTEGTEKEGARSIFGYLHGIQPQRIRYNWSGRALALSETPSHFRLFQTYEQPPFTTPTLHRLFVLLWAGRLVLVDAQTQRVCTHLKTVAGDTTASLLRNGRPDYTSQNNSDDTKNNPDVQWLSNLVRQSGKRITLMLQ
ncbi:hypothetical protein HDV00_001419 [Rhizophlyctis rosea]|nr:hypothetical protein HDV00_001419 [Rhizophlyctis rosea]